MPYTMVGTPALGFDLARLDQGAQAAVVVRTALACTPAELRRLAARARTGTVPEPRASLPMTAALTIDDGGPLAGAARLRLLETTTIGSVQALDRFVRSEVLEWAWRDAGEDPVAVSRAADVLRDAAWPAFVDDATPTWRRRVVAPFLAAGVPHADATVATGHDGVDDLLAELGGLDGTGRRAWRAAVDQIRPWTTGWAPAMHEATWALHLTDRLRLAADAQLAAVLAFRAAGFTAQDAAYGVWNAVSGTVHARLATDLLDPEHLDRLTHVHRATRLT